MTIIRTSLILTIILFLRLSLNGQIIIDLVEGDSTSFFTPDKSHIREWITHSDDNKYSKQLISNNSSESLGLAIGYLRINQDTSLNTFITSSMKNNSLFYWDGKKWKELSIGIHSQIVGIGGYKYDLYLVGQGEIYHYNGSKLKVIKKIVNGTVAADIAVDNQGNAWYITMGDEHCQNKQLNAIHNINSNGEEIANYPLSSNIYGCGLYGITLINNKLCIGFHDSNISFPNKIVTITLEDEVANIGEEPFNNRDIKINLSDLASSHPGIPKEKEKRVDLIKNGSKFTIYPNPTLDNSFVILESEIHLPYTIEIYNIMGQKIQEKTFSKYPIKIDISKFKSGIYFIHHNNESQSLLVN